MINDAIARLDYLCEHIPALILNISHHDFSIKPAANKWSKKEILGHLIDSATNNHQRFVRAQFERAPVIFYDSEQWNAAGYYLAFEDKDLVEFWKNYNKHLATLIKNIPENKLHNLCKTNEAGQAYKLHFLIKDYVEHLEHHLKQIVLYTG